MKTKLLLLFALILGINCYSQISFDKGYFIDNRDQKINCLIKNMDWKNNPTEFEYKLAENSESKITLIKSIKEFSIDSVSKYIRRTVKIDRSSDNITYLSADKNPVFQEEDLLLKVLVEGEANLYQYAENNLIRYFYSKNDSGVQQLIHKRYKNTEHKFGENNEFRKQLWIELNCPTFKTSKIEKVSYKKNDLVRYFIDFNGCNNKEFTSFEVKEKKDLFNLTVRPRINSSSADAQVQYEDKRYVDFGNNTGLGLGIEAEFILPFNKNKWAITFEPTLRNYKSEKTINADYVIEGKLTAKITYSSIEFPVSLRHYFFLNENSKLFVNASYIVELSSNSSIKYQRPDGTNFTDLKINTRGNIGLGLGYKYKDRYSTEIRLHTTRELLGDERLWFSDYNSMSLIFGYSFF
ncbi:tRNA modification GTPase [Flavobacterium algicola]|uniref:tRNA modification GTPase n=1 Tax=Flavobacterium algicola TaxID=556529 RepID=UPI001EFCED27|nr:tRNA modification GTPase [Flavobacterium algicola]MCG9793460.1 tRNA modification GTPase [Flavobacterium algicola]